MGQFLSFLVALKEINKIKKTEKERKRRRIPRIASKMIIRNATNFLSWIVGFIGMSSILRDVQLIKNIKQ